MRRGNIVMAAPAVLTQPSLFFATDRKVEDEISALFPPPVASWPQRTQFLPFVSPIQLWITFLQRQTPIFPAVYYFGKVVTSTPLHTSARNKGHWGQSTLLGRQEKQFSWSFQVSKWENILGCTGSNVEACPQRPFLLINLCFGSRVHAILTSRVKWHFAVKEGKLYGICLDTTTALLCLCFITVLTCVELNPSARKKMFIAVQLFWFLLFKPNLTDT